MLAHAQAHVLYAGVVRHTRSQPPPLPLPAVMEAVTQLTIYVSDLGGEVRALRARVDALEESPPARSPVLLGLRWRLVTGTFLECGRVALAKLGHDPYGMHLKNAPWREVVVRTYRAHRAAELE